MSRGEYVTATRVAELERGLSERDQRIIDSLDQLRIATTQQLARLHFAGLTESSAARQAPRALRRLRDLGVVTNLDRPVGGPRAGSKPTIWCLDVAGQRLASATGPAGNGSPRRPWIPGAPFVAHRLAVADCYVRLVETCRAGRRELLEFAAEPYCWRRFPAPMGGSAWLKPDAFARVAVGDFERGAFVEIDRATESRSTLKRKLATYRHYWETGREQDRRGYFPVVVWSVPTEARKELFVDLFASEPEEVWSLYRVTLADELVPALTAKEDA